MAQKTRSALKTDKDIILADNTTGDISEADLRGVVDDLADSAVFPSDISDDLLKLAGIEDSATADMTGAEIKVAYEGEPDTNAFTDAEQMKLTSIEAGATADMTGAEIKVAYEAEANTNAFTDAEKTKLAGLESSRFLGTYLNLAALQAAHPTPIAGSYAHVDAGVAADAEVYIWDNDDGIYVLMAGSGTTETAASIKTKYESNPDTNAYTDAEKTKLAGVATGATANTGALADKNTVATADIDDDAVTSAKLFKAATGTSVLAKLTAGAGAWAELAAGTNSVLRRVGGDLGFGLISKVHLNVNIVDNTILSQMATGTFKGRSAAGTGNVEDLTGAQATALLDTFTTAAKGVAPASGGGTSNFLRADGTWAAPAGGGSAGTTFHNATGATLTKGTPIALGAFDATSGNPGMIAADADGAGAMPCLGILTADVLNGADGIPAITGQEVAGLNTSGYTLGDRLYVSATAGSLTNVRPTSGFIQSVAVVSRVDVASGEIIVVLEEAGELFTEHFTVAVSDEATDLTTGTAKLTFPMPVAMQLTEVVAFVGTPATGAAIQVDVNEAGVSIFSTPITINAGEENSTTAAVPAIISDASIAQFARMTVDIDQVGSTVAGAGLKLMFFGYRA